MMTMIHVYFFHVSFSTDSVRAFKERNKMGRFDPEEQKRKEEQKLKNEQEEKQLVSQMKIGDRYGAYNIFSCPSLLSSHKTIHLYLC